MTAAERLMQLAGHGGVAASLLLAIGAGPATGVALVAYSRLATGSAAVHLLANPATPGDSGTAPVTGYSGGAAVKRLRARRVRDDELIWLSDK